MSDDDLIRRGDALALFTATDPNTVPGCRYVEHAQDYCGCAERIAAIRSLPAVAREPFSTVPIDTEGRDVVVVGAGPGAVVREVSADPARCDRCGWPLAASAKEGCVPGNCSQRPLPPSPSPPKCATCGGSGLVPEGVYDGAGLSDVDAEPCTACAGGRRA